MPRRDDIETILIIGSGPIVIGQACEFDYSGTRRAGVLRGGLPRRPANSNPATIMTDPEFADATYVEPLDVEVLAQSSSASGPDALLPTLGGQTALNLAMELLEAGVLDEYGVELIGATAEAIRTAEDRERFKAAMSEIGLAVPGRDARHARRGPGEVAEHRAPGRAAVVHPRRQGHRHRHDARGVRPHRRARPRRQPDHGDPHRGVGRGLEGVRARGHAGPRRQLRGHLLDREPRPDGRAHRRLDHRRPGPDPHRRRVPAHARRRVRVHPPHRRRDRRVERPVRRRPGHGRDGRHRDEPAGVALVGAASKATGFPIAKIAARLAVGYTLDEIPNDITGETPASFEPTIDYVVTKVPRWAFEKFPARAGVLGTQMQSVGEAMAIGRTFPESLQKAIRSLETGRLGLNCDPAEARARRARRRRARARRPRSRPPTGRSSSRPRCAGRPVDAAGRRDRGRPLVPRPDPPDRRGARPSPRSARRHAPAPTGAGRSGSGSPTPSSPTCGTPTRASARGRLAAGVGPHVQDRRHLRGRVRRPRRRTTTAPTRTRTRSRRSSGRRS